MTLVVLAAMTLAAIALTRSTDTANLIAGNLAFQQSVTQSADLGLEAAVAWLDLNTGSTLYVSNLGSGYSAVGREPSSGQSWDDFWTDVLDNSPSQPVTLAQDVAGNTVAYFIHRLCYGPNAEGHKQGDANTGCDFPSTTGQATGNSQGVSGPTLPSGRATQVNYRITVRIEGPRNTLSYVQSIVAK